MITQRYVLSQYVHVLPLNNTHSAIAHGLLLERTIVAQELAELLLEAARDGWTESDFCCRAPITSKVAASLFQTLVRLRYLVPEGNDEPATIREILLKKSLDRSWRHESTHRYSTLVPTPIGTEGSHSLEGRVRSQTEPLRIVLLGGCLVALASDVLKAIAPAFGIHQIQVASGWIGDLHLIDDVRPQVVVYQFGGNGYLAPLWDHGAFVDDCERRVRLEVLKERIRLDVEAISAKTAGCLLLVQGVASPQIPPRGRIDFREELDIQTIVYEINNHARMLIRGNKDALFVDEERIFSNAGKERMLDDLLSEYSHHGPLDHIDYEPYAQTPSRAELFGLSEGLKSVRLLAREYLKSYFLWKGEDRIKLIIVDLDNTLWRGTVGEDEPMCREMYEGIHQALKILKARGILLASCSKNNAEEVMRYWCSLPKDRPHLLAPDEFVIHRINWERKSSNILDILKRLETSPEATLFIDDNPVERAEVAASIPGIRTLGEHLHLVRAQLLESYLLEVPTVTGEASQRTEMVKGQLVRDAARAAAPDENTFLRGLKIDIVVKREGDDRNSRRMSELLLRTTQFTTRGKFLAGEVQELLGDVDARVYSATVSDRFVNYGLVGVCVLLRNRVEAFAVSCRVLPLKMAVPFLIAVLRGQCMGRVSAAILKTNRNHPCWNLFCDAGFVESRPGEFVLSELGRLSEYDADIWNVRALEDAGTSTL